jgi:iron complex transport system permease protein
VKRSPRRLFVLLIVGLAAMILLNVVTGEAKNLSPSLAVHVILRHVPVVSRVVPPLPPDTFTQNAETIVWKQRLPRALGGALVGMLLSLAGVAFQSFLRNPLADPYMTGVSAGAALGSVVVILLGGTGALAGFGQPLAAFATGLGAAVLVAFLAQKHGRLSSQTFLLAGIVVGTFLWSLIPLILSFAVRSGNVDRQSAILTQLLGSIQYLSWEQVGGLLPFALIGMSILWRGARELDLMAQGEEAAAHLGVDVERFKRQIILAGSLATAAAVSVAGIVAFVGLIVPHLARRLTVPQHRVLLPAATLLGGIVLVFADWLSRRYLFNLEIGVITSLVGAPIFCLLLRRES